jgi:hypothetical protein
MVLVGRREGMDIASFENQWRNNHAPLALAVIQKYMSAPPEGANYTQNRIVETLWQRSLHGSSHMVDGIAEFSVNPADPPAEARTTGELDNVLEDEKRFIGMWTQCVVESEGDDRPRESGSKVIVLAERSDDVDQNNFAAEMRAFFLEETAGIRQCCFNWTRASMQRQGLRHEPVAPDVFIELWFEDPQMAKQAVSETARFRKIEPILKRASIYRVSADRIL